MLNKKLMILAIFFVSLFVVSAVSAADNATDDVVSVDDASDDVVSVDDALDDVVNVNENNETPLEEECFSCGEDVVLSSPDKDALFIDENNEVLGASPPSTAYQVSVSDVSFYYGSSGSIKMTISSTSSNYDYKYDFYLEIYCTNDGYYYQVVNKRFASSTSSKEVTYNIDACSLDPGIYNIHIVNTYDHNYMDTATLTIKTVPHYVYSVSVDDIEYYVWDHDGLIVSLNYYNSDNYYYKYDYYLRIYDSNDRERSSTRFCDTQYTSLRNDYITLDPGIYTIKIFNTDDNYLMDTAKLTVKSLPHSLYSVNVSDVKLLPESSGYINMSICSTSNYEYTSDFIMKIYDVNESEIMNRYYNTYKTYDSRSFKVDSYSLPSGIYTIKIINRDDNYVMDTAKLIILKHLDYEMDYNIVARDGGTIKFNFNNPVGGSINVYFPNWKGVNSFNAEIINGKASITIPASTGGSHNFILSYFGDEVYESTVNDNIYVKYKTSPINIQIPDVVWGDNININPLIPNGATGYFEIYVNCNYVGNMSVGTSYNYVAVIGGANVLTVRYSGDDYYSSNTTSISFNVAKLDSTCSIEGNIEVDNSATVYVKLNGDATGKVSVTIKGTKYTSNLIDGVATFNIPSLAAGTYNVPIEYEGDSKYNSIYTTKSLEVTLKQSSITLNVNNVLTGRNVIVNPVVTQGATGNLKIYVDNVLKTTIAIGSSYTITTPTIGSHNVRVVYAGDSYHKGNENKTTFRVFTFYPIEVQNTAIIYGTDKHLQAIFYDEFGQLATNKLVAFRVNGEDTVIMTDANGLAVFNKNLPIGTYSVTVINAYVNEEKTYNLKVFTSIESNDMTRAYNTGMDFKVKLLDENGDTLSKGYALFNVNNKDYPVVADNNGVAILNANLPVGTHTVTITNGRTGETKTNKITIVPSVIANDMVRGYNSGIDFKAQFLDADAKPLNNQKIAFIVDNVEYEVTTDANGYAVLNEQFDVGEYKVTIINKVTGERAVKNLTIAPRIVENNKVMCVYGEESYYTVRIVSDDGSFVGANEIVNININNIDYQIRTNNNGYASFRIDKNIGSYDIFAEYKGYGVYNEVHVLQRVDSIINLDVSNVNYNQDEVLNIDLSSFNNAAELEIDVIGENGYHEVFYESARKSITIPISSLSASKYTVTAKYYDLNNHKYSSVSKTFTVSKINPKIIIVVENANVGETAKITVNILGVSGNVNIKVGNALNYNENLVKNDVIIKEIDNLPAGYYKVDVTYQGDENYNKLTQSADLYIIQPKTLTNIVAPNVSTTSDKGTTLVATLKDDKGKVLSGMGVTISFNGLNHVLTTDKNGQVMLTIGTLSANTYTATISFAGNDDYVGSTTTSYVIVTNAPTKPVPKTTLTLKTVKVKKSAKKLVLQATLKIDGKAKKGLKVIFKFNGKKYTAKTNKKGIAKVTIKKSVLKKLKIGKKVKYQASYGKVTVTKTVKVKK